jgi:hypothetical protein
LIGSGIGPWISTQGLREPRAKVTGMKQGGRVQIELAQVDPTTAAPAVLEFSDNGVHVLSEVRWMRVRCLDGGRHVICDILTRKAVA